MKSRRPPTRVALAKAPTGIHGFDEITHGGIPRGRPSLLCGSAGCGKTLFAMEFLVRGVTEFNEPGVFIAFEETVEELAKNVASLGFNLNELIRKKKLAIDYVHVDPNEIQANGDYDLEGLFIRLDLAIRTVGAKRVVIDTIEALFGALPNEMILRSELRRLFRWLKDKGVTAIITAERGEGALTRHGLEEYVADCVVLLDHRVNGQISTRRLRVVKYRGSHHATNEFPFLIDESGISVLPITSLSLSHQVFNERVSTGVGKLDEMLGGPGIHRGSSVLVSGAAGTGKSSLAASFVAAACARGERAVYFAFEESEAQIIRNMKSIGLNLDPFIKNGLLQFHAARPTYHSLEMHLVIIQQVIRRFEPAVAVFDPITNLTAVGELGEVTAMLTRLIDFLKMRGTSTLFSSLTHGGNNPDQSEVGVSSLMDTWLLVRNLEYSGERNRGLYILKSRGTAHSNQVREFVITSKGLDLVPVYTGGGMVLTGSARIAQEERDRAEALAQKHATTKERRETERRRREIRAQIAALQAQLTEENSGVEDQAVAAVALQKLIDAGKERLALRRGAAVSLTTNGGRR